MSYLTIIIPHEVIISTEALIFEMATTRFLDVLKEETSKMKENTVHCCPVNHLSSYTKTIFTEPEENDYSSPQAQ